MDLLFINNLKIETIIGVHAWERETLQPILINLELAYDNSRAALTDNLENALDYENLIQTLTYEISISKYYLIETLAEYCASFLHTEFNIPWVKITLEKPQAFGSGIRVGITIERGVKL